MTAIDVTAPTAWVTIALGILAPIIAAIINRPTWTAPTRRRMAIGVSVVLAVIAFVVTGQLDQFDVSNLVAVILAVIGLSQATYALIWKPTGITAAVETATSPTVVDALPGSTGQADPNELDAPGQHELADTDDLGRPQLPDRPNT